MTETRFVAEILVAQTIILGAFGLGQFMMLAVLVWQLNRACPGDCITQTFTFTDLSEPEGECASTRADK